MYVTKHGATRMRERVGLTKKNTDKFAEKALNLGIKHSEQAYISIIKMLITLEFIIETFIYSLMIS